MSLSDYLKVTKPKIIPLLILVAVTSAVIAARSVPSLRILAGLVAGGVLTSAGALATNSYLEMNIDSRMRRTKRRPLPAGKISPPIRALYFGLSLLIVGIIVSSLLLTVPATLLILLGAIVYIPIYTQWLKPRTSWNIVLGGFAGSCAALAGWYAVTTSQPVIAGILAALVFVWTPTHFWSLAVITEDDYSAVGIPMLPSVVGEKKAAKFIVANTLFLIPVSLLFYLYLSGAGGLVYLGGALVLDGLLLAANIRLWVSPTKANAWTAFKFSSPYLAVIFLLAAAGAII